MIHYLYYHQKASSTSRQKGVSLLITFFIMVIALSVVVSISSFIYNELRIIKNLGDATTSFYAAYSGIEKVSYYAKKNVCSVYPYNTATNPLGCPDSVVDGGLFSDQSLYCNNQSDPVMLNPRDPNSCSPNSCTACSISFTSKLLESNYLVTASETKQVNGSVKVEITSRGMFNAVSRQIHIDNIKTFK